MCTSTKTWVYKINIDIWHKIINTLCFMGFLRKFLCLKLQSVSLSVRHLILVQLSFTKLRIIKILNRWKLQEIKYRMVKILNRWKLQRNLASVGTPINCREFLLLSLSTKLRIFFNYALSFFIHCGFFFCLSLPFHW